MSLDLVYLIAVNTLICLGFWRATMFNEADQYEFDLPSNYHRRWSSQYTYECLTGKNLLWWVRYYGGWYLPDWIKKPLYQCPVCMASFHSVIPFLLYNFAAGWHWELLWWWPFHVMAVAGLNYVIIQKI